MDLHFIPGAVASDAERAAVDAAIAAHELESLPGRRHLLLPVLQAVQQREGWISEGALNCICERLQVAPAEAYGVASFYALLTTSPRPPRVAHVCDDIACRARGAERLCQTLQSSLGPPGGAALDATATWLRSSCLGLCDQAPAAFFQFAGEKPREWTRGEVTADAIVAQLRGGEPTAPTAAPGVPQGPSSAPLELRLLARAGRVDPGSLDAYRAAGGYMALRNALRLGPERVLREVTTAVLVGRGGAAFPTGRKWEAVARAAVRPHYLVCNADESEPGTFKDRVLMEEDPFALVEAMTIAGVATGCEVGFLYVRGEYPLATARVANAIEEARARGFLGDHLLGHGVRFDIEVRRGAGAYICGEETALFNSIEGFRGEPRNKPPFPVQAGLFGKPTVINNVETLLNVPSILLDGGGAFARIGTTASTGTKLFCVSGCVTRAGVYEVRFGTTLRELLSLAGGVADGRPVRAVLIGGAAGVFFGPDALDMTLTLEGARQAEATLGSGVVMVFDDRVDMTDIVLRVAAFFRDESCGQCVPCRVGTVRQEEALHRLAAGAPRQAEIQLIGDVARVMRDASICGLGHTASGAIQSALQRLALFRDNPS